MPHIILSRAANQPNLNKHFRSVSLLITYVVLNNISYLSKLSLVVAVIHSIPVANPAPLRTISYKNPGALAASKFM